MTQIIEVNLVDVLNRLESKIDNLDQKIDAKFTILDQKIDTKIEKLEADIDKRFGEVNTRLNTLTLGFLGIIGVLTGGLLTIVAKFTFFPNP